MLASELTSSDWSVATPSPAPATALVGRPEAAPRPGPTSRPQEPGAGPLEAGCEAKRPGVRPLRTNARHRNRAIEIQAIGQHFSLKRPQWYLTLYTKWTNKYQYSDESPRANGWNPSKPKNYVGLIWKNIIFWKKNMNFLSSHVFKIEIRKRESGYTKNFMLVFFHFWEECDQNCQILAATIISCE